MGKGSRFLIHVNLWSIVFEIKYVSWLKNEVLKSSLGCQASEEWCVLWETNSGVRRHVRTLQVERAGGRERFERFLLHQSPGWGHLCSLMQLGKGRKWRALQGHRCSPCVFICCAQHWRLSPEAFAQLIRHWLGLTRNQIYRQPMCLKESVPIRWGVNCRKKTKNLKVFWAVRRGVLNSFMPINLCVENKLALSSKSPFPTATLESCGEVKGWARVLRGIKTAAVLVWKSSKGWT